MTKGQFVATSFLGAIPAGGLITVLAFAALEGAQFTLPMWILFGAVFLAALVTLASPVIVALLIPAGAAPAVEDVPVLSDESAEARQVSTTDDDIDSLDSDGELDELEDEGSDYNAAETEVAQPGELDDDDYDDDDDFQIGGEFDDEFDDFDDDEDFV